MRRQSWHGDNHRDDSLSAHWQVKWYTHLGISLYVLSLKFRRIGRPSGSIFNQKGRY
jgi:hypothetical protein